MSAVVLGGAALAGIWADLQKLGIPGIQGVWSIPEAAGWGMTVVSIKQMYAGHAPQVMALAAQCTAGAYFGKYVIVVDDDIDPSNIGQVLWRWRHARVRRSRSTSCARPGARSSIRASTRRRSGRGARRP